MKTAALNRKHGRSTVLGKEIFLGYISISPKRVPFGDEGEGYMKTKSAVPKVESLVRGIWRLRVSEAERRVR